MSGLSMADMRRVGVRRNAELGAAEPPKTGFLSKLGFADPRVKMAPEAKTSASASVSTEDACALALRQSKGLLRQSLQRHALAGATITSLTAIGVSGAALSAPIGAVLGGVAGWAVARRAQASPVDQQKGVALAAKSAPALFACFEQGAVQLGFAKPKLAVRVVEGCGLRVMIDDATRQKLSLHIGLPLLCVLSSRQLGALFLQQMAMARGSPTDAQLAAPLGRLGALTSRLGGRPTALRFQGLDALCQSRETFHRHWAQAIASFVPAGDARASQLSGAHSLVDALFCQGLLAASLAQSRQAGQSLSGWFETIRQPWSRPFMDQALRTLARHQEAELDSYLAGFPVMLFARVQRLGSDTPVPVLPSPSPAITQIAERQQKALLSALAGRRASKADQPGKPIKSAKTATRPMTPLAPAAPVARPLDRLVGDARPATPAAMPPVLPPALPSSLPPAISAPLALPQDSTDDAAKPKSLFARFFGGSKKDLKKRTAKVANKVAARKAKPAARQGFDEPLREADALFKSNAGSGIAAYRAIVESNPRWALARLRLGEALVEAGYVEGVNHLMASAEQLPSALPAILETLKGAMAMVSPLEEEPLRNTLAMMEQSAEAVAAERTQIELNRLEAHRLDEIDQASLQALFARLPGLREAWVFSAPLLHMPQVAHHAIIGLAPRLSPAHAERIAVQIAENAAISGTVAVHLETGKPTGPLGDALASRSSLWRLMES